MINEYGNEYHHIGQLMEIVIAEENRHDNNFRNGTFLSKVDKSSNTFEDDVMEIRKR